ncbi:MULTISPECIES: hypothetical protein [unclassified Kribbella]|uniref:hypothetical protein n=1 Tax=unclassified Kribbella TaxID=2644121 RepID=UPI00301798D9
MDVRPSEQQSSLRPLAAAAAAWILAVGALALAGGFTTEDRIPVGLIVAAVSPPLAFGVAWCAAPAVRRWAAGLDLRILVALQLWRVIGAAFLFVLATGEVSGTFAWPAGIGDIATGIAAMAVLSALLKGSLTRGRLLAFSALGFGDFIVAFVVAGAVSPESVADFPLALFPAAAIPCFAVLHVLALIQVRRLPVRVVSHSPAVGGPAGNRGV